MISLREAILLVPAVNAVLLMATVFSTRTAVKIFFLAMMGLTFLTQIAMAVVYFTR